MQGIIQSVQTFPGGGYPTTLAVQGSSVLTFSDASDFDPTGGTLDIDGVELTYLTVDLEDDTVTLQDALFIDVAEEDFVQSLPPTESAHATVVLDDDIVEAVEVPYQFKALLPEGLREPGEGETVIIEETSLGSYKIVDVPGLRPSLNADFVEGAERLILENRKMLGEVLAENATKITEAAGRLTTAEGLISDAFDEITILPDNAYVDAAKQQAIDAAAIDAQRKDDLAQQQVLASAGGRITTYNSPTEPTGNVATVTVVDHGDASLTVTTPDGVDHGDGTVTLTVPVVTVGDDDTWQIMTGEWGGLRVGDVWFVGGGQVVKYWTGTAWALVSDPQTLADIAKQQAIDTAALDATAKASEAMTKANEALTKAQQAAATADGAIRTYYATTPPWADGSTQPADVLGDMWFNKTTGQAYRWNGTTWQIIQDGTIAQALAAAQTAQTTADGKITAFYQDSEPLEGEEGDLWYDTDDNNRVYYRRSSTWVDLADKRIAQQATAISTLQTDLIGVEGKADGKSNIYVQTAAPTGLDAADKGDIWINNGATPRMTKVWTGTAWIDADSRITQAVADVATKITTYYTSTTTAPTGTFVNGDLWIDSNGKIARRNATTWVTVSDPKALAAAAEQAAKTAAAADATSKAAAAEAAAKAAAATDAQTKADAAKAAAEAAAKTYSDTVSSGAQQAAIDAAKADATAKADAAEAAAKTAAAADASSKAAAAEAAAKTAAAADAKTKADAALAAAKVYADAAAGQAETNAKAYATTRTDGLAKTLWSTALPGTTPAPQNSVWYREDGAGKIIAVFTQTAAGPTGTSWSARPITSEAIDNLDVGKLTAASGTINDLVANSFAAKLASIIQADIGNLTVTGVSNLNEVVAERIWGNIASFVQITADRVLAGDIQAVWTITSDGKIIAGDPAGRSVEMDDESIVVYDVDADGVRYVSTLLGGPGADSLTLTDATGEVTAGFDADGAMTAQSGSVSGDMYVNGKPILGTKADADHNTGEAGWLDQVPDGAIQRQSFGIASPVRATLEEWGFAALRATLLPDRLYQVMATMEVKANVVGGWVMAAIRYSDTGSANQNSTELARFDSSPAQSSAHTASGMMTGWVQPTVETDAEFLITYRGLTGATPNVNKAHLYILDLGPAIPGGGGGYKHLAPPAGSTTPPPPPATAKKYVSTWTANGSASYRGNNTKRTDAAGELVQGYTSYAPQNGTGRAAFVFTGNATSGETSKTIGEATGSATISKVEVYLYFTHWLYGAGGTACLNKLGMSSLPAELTEGSTSGQKTSGGWGRGVGRWVVVPTSWFTDSNRGISLGRGVSTSGTFYGRAAGHTATTVWRRPKVRITYTR